ncbi:hypothetical protein [Peribacillus muralis]|uniref:hypothetical protein n=1 Tax=Peribacillus muralis TaxID=264697 RepID=UPI00070B0485|nr:hypothetical protein [Peribacillus muralis]MCK1993178.1 hypothetical protein [Peribacillus muralis]MCK2013732.1 hypothetical protein [Peribacillus muralis]
MSKEELKKEHVPENSSMAKDFEEMKELGKQMENQRTNEELKERHKRPGTVQHEVEVDKD